ncbi:MAG: hypothetical protein DRR19_32440 [Candidatus Parabeggiatoa sp. nov. 1]|nr:MAG: hypothetical protein DRR19_32440 [Gammaproteobacteria bacterium]
MNIDMSSKAVSRRLEQVEQLRRLCLSLSQSSGAEKYQKASNIPVGFQRLKEFVPGEPCNHSFQANFARERIWVQPKNGDNR